MAFSISLGVSFLKTEVAWVKYILVYTIIAE